MAKGPTKNISANFKKFQHDSFYFIGACQLHTRNHARTSKICRYILYWTLNPYNKKFWIFEIAIFSQLINLNLPPSVSVLQHTKNSMHKWNQNGTLRAQFDRLQNSTFLYTILVQLSKKGTNIKETIVSHVQKWSIFQSSFRSTCFSNLLWVLPDNYQEHKFVMTGDFIDKRIMLLGP